MPRQGDDGPGISWVLGSPHPGNRSASWELTGPSGLAGGPGAVSRVELLEGNGWNLAGTLVRTRSDGSNDEVERKRLVT